MSTKGALFLLAALAGLVLISRPVRSQGIGSLPILDIQYFPNLQLGQGLELSDPGHPTRASCVAVSGPTPNPVTASALFSQISAIGSNDVFVALDNAAATEARSISASGSATYNYPLVAAASLDLSAAQRRLNSEQSNSLVLIISQTQLLNDLRQGSVTPLPSVPSGRDDFAAQCGTKYISGFLYGAKVGLVATVSNLTREDRSSFLLHADASGSYTFESGSSISGAAKADTETFLDAQSSKHNVQFSAFALGSPQLVRAINSIQFTGITTAEGALAKIASTMQSANAGPVAGPVAYLLSDYPQVPQAIVANSDKKADALVALAKDASEVAALHAHAIEYQTYPWNLLAPPSPQQTKALTMAFQELADTYNSCSNVDITDASWSAPLGPPVCSAHPLFNALDLVDDPHYGLATPPPISATWGATGNADPHEFDGKPQNRTGVTNNAAQSLVITNAYVSHVKLQFASNTSFATLEGPAGLNSADLHNIYDGPPPGPPSSPIAKVPVNVSLLCGGSYTSTLYTLIGCKKGSVVDHIVWLIVRGKIYSISGDVDLTVNTAFGQTCTWDVGTYTLNGSDMAWVLAGGPFGVDGC